MFTKRRIVCLALLVPTVAFATKFGDIPASQVIGTPSITNDTNITLTLGGTPTDALLKPFSLTLGWTGTLSITRGGTGSGTASGALSNLGGEPALGNPSTNGYILSSTTAGVRSWVAPPTGGGTPGSPTNSFQYNNAGAFGGASNFLLDTTTGAG